MKDNWVNKLMPRYMKDKLRTRLSSAPFCSEEHWCRVVMNRETLKLVADLDTATLDALEISGSRWSLWPFQSYRSVSYPEFDICNPHPEIAVDMVIAEQVFEHLLRPYQAARSTHDFLRPAGYLLITTPFLIKVHDAPVDCSRWTETGLKYFLAECGFPLEKIRTGSWGNRKCIVSNFNRWPCYKQWMHSLDNEPDFPMVVWALAQKQTS